MKRDGGGFALETRPVKAGGTWDVGWVVPAAPSGTEKRDVGDARATTPAKAGGTSKRDVGGLRSKT